MMLWPTMRSASWSKLKASLNAPTFHSIRIGAGPDFTGLDAANDERMDAGHRFEEPIGLDVEYQSFQWVAPVCLGKTADRFDQLVTATEVQVDGRGAGLKNEKVPLAGDLEITWNILVGMISHTSRS